MTRARLYIADMDLAFVSRVRGAIASCAGIEIIGSAGNGRRALQDIVRLAPDVLLTDIPLPEMDGFTLLREVKRLRLPPQVIVCTRFYSEVSMQCACKYGAAFFLCKPIDPETLPGLILECGKCAADPQPSNISPLNTEESMRGVVAKDLLRQLGLSPRLNGSVYLLETMLHLHGDSLLFKNLSHGLYAELARRMGTGRQTINNMLRDNRRGPTLVTAIAVAEAFGGAVPERFAVVAPGARWETKKWPADFFSAVIASVARREPGLKFLLAGTRDEAEDAEKILAKSAAAGLPVASVCGRTGVGELMETIRMSSLMVCNDSGPMHIAAALGVPVVAMFGPTDPALTGPYCEKKSVFVPEIACNRCFLRYCKDSRCHAMVDPETVAAASCKLLMERS